MAFLTLGQEAALIDSLVATGRCEVDIIGESVQGRPIRLLRMGNPPPPPDARPLVLLVGMQHGLEPAGREAILNTAQMLSTTSDAGLLSLLSTYGVHMIPSVNPDGFVAGTRNNANDQDLNRNWIALTQPETRAVSKVVGRLQPMILVDHHEYVGTVTRNDIECNRGGGPQIHPLIVGHGSDLRDQILARMTTEGWSNDHWGPDNRGDPIVLDINSSLRNIVSIIIETNRTGNPTETDRVTMHVQAIEEILDFAATNADTIAADIETAKAELTAEGAAGTEPFDVRGGNILDPPPLGYRITGVVPQFHLQVFGIQVQGPGVVVSMAQPAQPLIPFLFDPLSEVHVTIGQRLFSLEIPVTVASVQDLAPVVAGSHRMVVEAYVLREFASGNNPGGEPIPILGGEVVMDGTADVQRTLTLTTGGVDFPRRIGDLLLPDGTEIFVRRGVDIGTDILWAPLGYYRIETPEQDDAPDGPIVIRAFDRMKGLIGSPLLAPRQFTEEDTFADVFTALVGDVYPGATILFDDDLGDEPLGRVLVVEQNRYEPLRTLAQGRGKIVYWDGEGVLRVETAPDPSEPLWEVRAGRGGVLSRVRRRITRTDVVNAVVVRSQASRDLGPARAVAIDDGPQSITRFGGRFGAVPAHITVPVETTVEQARETARLTLLRRAGLPFQVEVESVPNPALKPFDPFRVTLRNGERERHVAERITLPLTAQGVMRIASREQRGSLVRVVTT